MFGKKKKKKGGGRDQVFKREAYIPKARLQRTERRVPSAPGRKSKEEGKRGLGRTIVVSMLWILFFGEILFVIFFANFFAITNFSLQKENKSDHIRKEEIEARLKETAAGKWFGLVPKNNLLLLRPEAQERQLLARYPKLATVEIRKEFPHTLKVSITEKPFQLLWCRRTECFLVNKEGYTEDAGIFFQYPEEQGPTFSIQDTADVPIERGTRVLEKEDWQFINDLTADFTLRTGLIIEGVLERPSIYAKELRVRTNKGFTIFFHTRLPVNESLDTLMLVLTKEIPEGEWGQIDYIDLRTENRIYYTRKDRAPEKTEAQKKREEEAEKKRKEEEEKNKQESQSIP